MPNVLRSALLLLAIVPGAHGCSARPGPSASSRATTKLSPSELLQRAIDHAGGAAALTAARAFTWEGDGIVHAGGRLVQIAGTWAIQPPDTAVISTFDIERGRSTLRALVVAAPRGWLVNGEQFSPMPESMLATERDEFYMYEVMRLVPLREPGVTLTPVPADSAGHAGFRAERAGRPWTELHFDRTGRLAHLRARIANPGGGEPVMQDIWFSGEIESRGVRWPRDFRIFVNGQPFFGLTLRTLRVHERVEDPRLRGPG